MIILQRVVLKKVTLDLDEAALNHHLHLLGLFNLTSHADLELLHLLHGVSQLTLLFLRCHYGFAYTWAGESGEKIGLGEDMIECGRLTVEHEGTL